MTQNPSIYSRATLCQRISNLTENWWNYGGGGKPSSSSPQWSQPSRPSGITADGDGNGAVFLRLDGDGRQWRPTSRPRPSFTDIHGSPALYIIKSHKTSYIYFDLEARSFSICSIFTMSDSVAPKIKPCFTQDFRHSEASMISSPKRFRRSLISNFALLNRRSGSSDIAGILISSTLIWARSVWRGSCSEWVYLQPLYTPNSHLLML